MASRFPFIVSSPGHSLSAIPRTSLWPAVSSDDLTLADALTFRDQKLIAGFEIHVTVSLLYSERRQGMS